MTPIREPYLSARPVYLELCSHGIDLQKGTVAATDHRGGKMAAATMHRLSDLLERHQAELARICLDDQDPNLQAIKEEAKS